MLVGVIPNSPDFRHPADRRRYLFYFAKNGISYETAQFEKRYDSVYISLSADLNQWWKYGERHSRGGRSPRVVFDLSDSYLTSGGFADRLRPVFHYLAGRTRSLTFSYKSSILRMLKRSDVVLCGSEEQRMMLAKLHPNVIVMRDYYGYDIRAAKRNYALSANGDRHILWEGLSHGNIRIFQMLRRIVDGLGSEKVHVHVATDSTYCRFGSTHLCQPTFRVLQKVFAKSSARFHLYDWNLATFSSIASSCDLAVIPIPDDPVMINKPENKLLLLWSIGLPVITTSTPSYARVMHAAGLPFACTTAEHWRDRILALLSSEDARASYMVEARRYVAEHCSDAVLLGAWDRVFGVGIANKVEEQ
jgi:hypothetical protein